MSPSPKEREEAMYALLQRWEAREEKRDELTAAERARIADRDEALERGIAEVLKFVAGATGAKLPVARERLAQLIHEAGRVPVQLGLTVVKLGAPFLGWDEITEEAREGRRVMADFLFEHLTIFDS